MRADRDTVRRYGFAALCTIVATWARLVIAPYVGDRMPFGFYFVSVVLAAWIGGSGPAVFALLTGTFAAAHFIIPPERSLFIHNPSDRFSLVIYVVIGVVLILLFHRSDRQKLVAEKHADANLELNNRLRELDRRKDDFLALLAHELRNPLAPLTTGIDLLNRTSTDQHEQAVQTRAMLSRQLNHLVRLVDDLLDISRFVRGQVTLQPERFDLREVVDPAVEMTRPQIETRSHRLSLVTPDEPMIVIGDRVRLVQVVANLLTNAAKYTPRGGRILLLLERIEEQMVVHVQDNGIGIDSSSQAQIFELFVQVDPSRTRDYGGLGLGLALVRELVRLHEGNVSVDSEGPGRGSRFTVRLPAAPAISQECVEPQPVGEISNGRHSIAPVGAPPRVLIVDDNVDAANTLQALLSLEGFEVHASHDGAQALRVNKTVRPEFVILDIGMPGMDGYDVAHRLRREQSANRQTLIAATGWGGTADINRAREAGFDHHLTKPIDLAELLALLNGQREAVSA